MNSASTSLHRPPLQLARTVRCHEPHCKINARGEANSASTSRDPTFAVRPLQNRPLLVVAGGNIITAISTGCVACRLPLRSGKVVGNFGETETRTCTTFIMHNELCRMQLRLCITWLAPCGMKHGACSTRHGPPNRTLSHAIAAQAPYDPATQQWMSIRKAAMDCESHAAIRVCLPSAGKLPGFSVLHKWCLVRLHTGYSPTCDNGSNKRNIAEQNERR